MAKQKEELTIADYKYVDAWYSNDKGKPIPWRRIETTKVKTFQQEEAINFNCFSTVQRFANPKKVKGESFMAPLYFDLDYEPDPQVSQADAVKLIDFFMNELDLKESDIWVYFSGSKGFHILINSEALGIVPRNDLHKIFKHIAGYLIHRLDLKSLDLVVYTEKRMIRLPNSIHHKTRLHKIELSISELKNQSLEEIKALAEQPRREDEVLFSNQDRKKESNLRRESAKFFRHKQEEYLEAAATVNQYEQEEFKFQKDKPPAAIKDLLENGWSSEGGRNQATVQLACYYKEAGYNKQETLDVLEDWVVQHTSASSNYQKQQRVANTRSVVDAIFSKENEYRFSTAAILSVLNKEKRAAYAMDLLKYQKDEEDEHEIESLHLSQTGEAKYTNKLVKTRVMVVGKRSSPYIVPQQIEYTCWGLDACKKKGCTLHHMPNSSYIKTLTVKDRELIQMSGVGDDNIKGILKDTVSFIRKCKGYSYEVLETTNVEELLVIPMAENEDSEDEQEGRYVLRRIYSIGESNLEENKYYEITGYVVPHPKNQESTLMIKQAKPLQDVVEKFEYTDEIKDQLTVFQPSDYSPEAINEKLSAICDDLTYNVTKIVERDDTLLGALLTYHSVLRFKVPWANDPIRGWLELKIVGDTGTGKSELLENLQKFAGLGNRVNAESTSRTGLTYKMEQSGTGGAWYIVWGAWPLADKELIWIDEDTGITKEEYGEMTLARSDGRLEVKRAVTAETPCRVRAILSGNVPKGKRIADYSQGVESLKDIFNNEDIRRFDFAIFMRAADVDPELYNRELSTFPSIVDSEALKNNILFAWSRKPEDVLFTDDALQEILSVSTSLSKIYGKANDIPLVSPSDQRNKVARLAVSLAALTHSIDESGERIRVLPGHVTYIYEYLKALYNAPGCGLNYYSRLAIKEEDMTQERYERITTDLKKVDTLKGENKFFEFIKLFAQQRYLRLSDIEAMLSIEKDEAKAIINQLTRMRMIINTSGGYRKTPRFNAYIAFAMQQGVFDELEDDDYY
ncbi:DNA primase small subunit domain-containing protein [Ornithinibacillus sp. JPR2-1]|uniref:DNA primase small subunit domain-containing protein n=1 Tax=Ornithinibacillus sp. JPR2-1 TaxID=2094019 RepID=UPI0031CDFEAB